MSEETEAPEIVEGMVVKSKLTDYRYDITRVEDYHADCKGPHGLMTVRVGQLQDGIENGRISVVESPDDGAADTP